jgi:hypothetical protein
MRPALCGAGPQQALSRSDGAFSPLLGLPNAKKAKAASGQWAAPQAQFKTAKPTESLLTFALSLLPFDFF